MAIQDMFPTGQIKGPQALPQAGVNPQAVGIGNPYSLSQGGVNPQAVGIGSMFPTQAPSQGGVNPQAVGTGNPSSAFAQEGSTGIPQNNPLSLPSLWNTGLNIYDYYKGRDTASDAAKNLSKGYTSAGGALTDWLGPYADRGNFASDAYMGLAGQYPTRDFSTDALDLPSYSDYDPGEFDASKLRDEQYLRETPGYQFRLEEGTKARENAAAARGMNLSTNILRDLDKYSQGMASQEYEKEYGRMKGEHEMSTDRAGRRYAADQGETLGEFQARRQDSDRMMGDRQQQMQNYTPLMNQGYGAASTVGTGVAQLEVARGGAAATREQNQGTMQNQFLNSMATGATSPKSVLQATGLDNFSLDDIGNAFGNMRDWFADPNSSFGGSMDNFWAGIRDFELGDLEGLISDFF